MCLLFALGLGGGVVPIAPQSGLLFPDLLSRPPQIQPLHPSLPPLSF